MNLYEILVPTVKPDRLPGRRRFFALRHHRRWDEKVRGIAGGLTVYRPAVGQWVSPQGDLFYERMIPVRVACSEADIERIADLTAAHYRQRAVLYYLVSDRVVIKHYGAEA
jgi:hypothetical protein